MIGRKKDGKVEYDGRRGMPFDVWSLGMLKAIASLMRELCGA